MRTPADSNFTLKSHHSGRSVLPAFILTSSVVSFNEKFIHPQSSVIALIRNYYNSYDFRTGPQKEHKSICMGKTSVDHDPLKQ